MSNHDQDQKQQAEPGTAETEAEQNARNAQAQDPIAESVDDDSDMPDLDPAMFQQVQDMMEKMGKVDELERENAELKGKLARLAADFDNYRRRTADDTKAAEGAGVSKAAETLLPIYDDLSRALEMGAGDPAKILPGLQGVQGALLRAFEKLGVSAVGKVGEKFDPTHHEALQVVPGDQDDLIVQVFQQGFMLGDRLVRPARVVVSRSSN